MRIFRSPESRIRREPSVRPKIFLFIKIEFEFQIFWDKQIKFRYVVLELFNMNNEEDYGMGPCKYYYSKEVGGCGNMMMFADKVGGGGQMLT